MDVDASLKLEHALARAELATDALFGTSLSQMRAEDLLSVLEDGRQAFILPTENLVGKSVVQLAAKHGLTSSVCKSFHIGSYSTPAYLTLTKRKRSKLP
jgi:hypothetical protein